MVKKRRDPIAVPGFCADTARFLAARTFFSARVVVPAAAPGARPWVRLACWRVPAALQWAISFANRFNSVWRDPACGAIRAAACAKFGLAGPAAFRLPLAGFVRKTMHRATPNRGRASSASIIFPAPKIALMCIKAVQHAAPIAAPQHRPCKARI